MRTSRRRPLLPSICATLVVVAGLATVSTVAAPQASAAVTDLRLNEVESNGGTPVDWVELVNTGSETVDASGLRLKDSDDTRTFAIPAGTTVAPGGFVAVDVDVDGGFGLGGGDSARLFEADGTTLIDSYSWTAHATTTYGRCPDGSGAFRASTASTKGAANDCSSPLRINEVESNGGTPVDWVELVNTGSETVDASGLRLKDSDDTRTFAIPAGTTVAPGGFVAVDVDVDGGFGLGGGDSARLFEADGTTLIDSYSWTAHAATTYGRCPNPQGAFTTTTTSTKGAANDCGITVPAGLKINEVESNGDTIGDFAEVKNTGTTPLDISGYRFRDNDVTHAQYSVPAGTTLAPGAYFVFAEADFGFGLGGADSATVWLPDGTTVVDSYAWTAHASTSYGRCPDGTGAFTTTGASTRGAANDCASTVRINEVESSGGTPGDWIELVNTATAPADVSGLLVKDSGEPGHTIPAGTTIPGGGYLVIEEAQLGSGLGGADSARLLGADGTTVLDSYSWTAHATTSYGRCPNGTGAFATTQVVTKGAANNCLGDVVAGPWPGGPDVTTVDPQNTFSSNLSGLMYEPSGTEQPGSIWAVRNGPGALYELTPTATGYAPQGEWAAGKLLRYPDGTGDVDAEGVTFTAAGPDAGVYVASERNNAAGSVSRPAILRYDPTAPGTELRAQRDWNLSADLPGLGGNLGLEAIAWVPDSYLTDRGFVDQNTGAAYAPATYPGHGTGLFLVGVEQTGRVYAYALDQGSDAYTRVASFASGFPGVMELYLEPESQQLWVVCDDTCQGRSARFDVDATGSFAPTAYHERPTGMPNLNNEGFTLAPRAECVGDRKPAFWADDSSTGGHALRRGSVACTPRAAQTVTFTSAAPASPVVGQTYEVAATGGASGNPVTYAETSEACTLDGTTVTIVAPGACTVVASQAGDDDYLAATQTQSSTAVRASTAATVTITPTTLRAAITVVAPGAATVAGDVTFLVDGEFAGVAPVVDGVATLDHLVAPGRTRSVYVAYSGSPLLNATNTTVQRRDPLVTFRLTSTVPPTAEGWWTAPVTVTYTCTPQGSPVTSCPEPVVLDRSGTDVGVTREATAADGGVGTAVVAGVRIDLVAPRVRIAGVTDGAAYRADPPTPRCVASDAVSGIASCTLESTRRGTVTTVTATAVDVAGLESTATITWRRPSIRVEGTLGYASDGRYVVERGTVITVDALLAAGPTPRLLGPVAVGTRPPGPGLAMTRGATAGGLTTWRRSVRVTGTAREQKLVVRVGTRQVVVPLRLR